MRITKTGNEHATVEFSGDENVNALRLEELEKNCSCRTIRESED